MSYGRLCRWEFGGTECNVDGFADLSGASLSVSGATSDRGGSTVLYDATLSQAADFWNYGRLTCNVGGVSQERRVVDFESGGTVVFDVLMSLDVSGLTKYALKAGCPKTWTACSAVSAWGPVSGNTVNFGGFLHVSKRGDWRPLEG